MQASGCAPIVAAFAAGAAESQPWPNPRTVAFGITVPKALGDFLVLDAVRGTGGTAVAVDDEDLLADQREIARLEGSLICPEGAACVTAVRQLRESGWLAASDEVVVLNTGTGLKYPDLIAVDVPVLAPGDPIPAADPAAAERRAAERGTAERGTADPAAGESGAAGEPGAADPAAGEPAAAGADPVPSAR